MILGCLEGKPVVQIARDLQVRPNTVINWRRRFSEDGLPGLEDKPRSGKPAEYGDEFRNQVLKLLETPPPPGQASWDGLRSLSSQRFPGRRVAWMAIGRRVSERQRRGACA
jgi:transposase